MTDLLEVALGPVARGWFTTRGGGAPAPAESPFWGMNLAGHVGDDPERVRRNRAELAQDLGLKPEQLAWMQQVHSALVAHPQTGREPTADALVVDGRVDVAKAAGVLVADCVPLLLADGQLPLISAVHAGRKGMLDGVVQAAVSELRRLGAQELYAAIGPSICGSCYEVPASMRDESVAIEPACGAVTSWGTPAVDVAAGVRAQLERLQVKLVQTPQWCTLEDERFFSFRREGTTGRLAGVVQLS
ncbi:Laccase domain protein yfiH [Actinomyces bovis]|uniref:Laccase domain protein yfiH n=1 Tax=Actinomyces bovis TaxID=1658 RepID=A0ABY1VP93_9ACTO|nr:polyphenol oxidase family protein [Actinomyces bovis]SPT53936.1 Laccase domain protein yfiH [Actinomyces bovis]VEG53437.1 Laccase domain protein yfiH [Actinomyces israelii]